jgi:hypothetical protein
MNVRCQICDKIGTSEGFRSKGVSNSTVLKVKGRTAGVYILENTPPPGGGGINMA